MNIKTYGRSNVNVSLIGRISIGEFGLRGRVHVQREYAEGL
jgi:hypothetical protein